MSSIETPPLPTARDCCLFLDIDGTLLDIAPTPDAVSVDEPLRGLLRGLEKACDGALALVSGRPIADIDELFEPLFLAVAGVHGCERRDALGHWMRPAFRDSGFAEFRDRLKEALSPLDGLLIENKDYALAMHYRLSPKLETPLRSVLKRVSPDLPDTHEVIEGDEVIEIKPASHDKASAIEAFMQEAPFAGRYPIFIGDDLTDQDGFVAVRRHHGMAIAVGSNVNSEWRLDAPRDVRRWLAAFLAARIH
jgi:trehalose 6-phosphate phosphatase